MGIWDRLNRERFAATDPIGFGPFFYYDAPVVFAFYSEIKGVEAAKNSPNYHFTIDQDWYDCTRELLCQAVEKRLNPAAILKEPLK